MTIIRRKTVVQIDGGHLRVHVKNAGINYSPEFIEQFAHSLLTTEEDLIRILYYDCLPPNRVCKTEITGKEITINNDGRWLDHLACRDLFAVRLGQTKWRGWNFRRGAISEIQDTRRALLDTDFEPKFEQKGVDLKIGLDIAIWSFEKTVERIIMVTNDSDLVPAMKLARRSGLQIIGVELPKTSLARDIVRHIDFKRKIPWPQQRVRKLTEVASTLETPIPS